MPWGLEHVECCQIHRYIHTYIYPYIPTCTHTGAGTGTGTDTYIHRYVFAHVDIHVLILILINITYKEHNQHQLLVTNTLNTPSLNRPCTSTRASLPIQANSKSSHRFTKSKLSGHFQGVHKVAGEQVLVVEI
jgi:hypothetical protein